MWSKSEIKGKGKQVKGSIKDKIGEVTNNPRLEARGKADRLEGQVQQKVGKARRRVGEVFLKARKGMSGR